ncbi:MAG: hypothetical protein QM703_04260 [Gemmatales bacterium]
MPDQVKPKKQEHGTPKISATAQVTPSVTVTDELEGAPSLTPELLASYQDSNYRLLVVLGLVLAFILACFPISDPEIFFSLETGKLVSSGEFPWGTDPFGFADGEHAPWAHAGWLGDLTIYSLYLAGGGPLLVLVRAMLVVFVFWLLLKSCDQNSLRLTTVVVVLLGIITFSHRLYFRTEFFSFVLLGITFSVLAFKPAANGWFSRLHQLTAGRCYWLLPLIFILWVNLDKWFFLGLATVVLWCVGSWLTSSARNTPLLRALTISTLLCVVASLASPFHVKAFTQIPSLLMTPTAAELDARLAEQRQQNPDTRMTEHQRLFASPWSRDFIKNQRSEGIAGLAGQAPFLPSCYPLGMSFSEWAYYPLMVAALLSLLAVRKSKSLAAAFVLLFFALLSIWQSRFIGFFAVGGVAMAIVLFQSQPVKLPHMNRFAILGGQLLCLFIGVVLQIISLLHLIPTPDYSPSSIGHVHPRGSFGFSFRYDSAIQEASEVVNHWRTMKLTAGKPFHVDWIDVTAYDVWFNPGGRHFFDTRLGVHSAEATRSYFAARDALMGVITDPVKPDGSNVNKTFERQAVWQKVFKDYDISYLIVKRRGQTQGELVRTLLLERDDHQQPVWKPLRLHNGLIYALAWVGSPHWQQMKKLQFDSGDTIFRQGRNTRQQASHLTDKESLSRFLLADPPRRPAALDESEWYLFQNVAEHYAPGHNPEPLAGMLERFGAQQMFLTSSTLAARLATPMNQLPYLPLWFSYRQSSSSVLYMGLDAVRRGYETLSPAAPANYRLEAALKYSQASNALSEYESAFSPAAGAYREPLQLFLLKQLAGAGLDAGQASALSFNLQLARSYLNAGALDAAEEQYLLVRSFIERANPEQAESNIKKLDAECKQKFGFDPEKLINEIKARTDAWKRQVANSGWNPQENESESSVINRAKLALQVGLPKRALEELLAAGIKSVDVSRLAVQIYSMLGQYDVVWQELIQKSPELRKSLKAFQLHQLGALGEWSLGHPEKAAEHRLALAKLIEENAAKTALYGGQFMLQGTDPKGVGNILDGDNFLLQAMNMSDDIAGEKIAAGMLYLEAGQPQKAASLFKEAILNIEPNSPWRPLVERYYLQITGEVLK